MRASILSKSIVVLALLLPLVVPAWAQTNTRVYELVAESISGTFDEVETALTSAAGENGWELLASTDVGVPGECIYGARVLTMYRPDYASRLMEINRKTGPYGIVDRINIFEDENGLHISVINPHSINRTILMDDNAYTDLSVEHLRNMRTMIADAIGGASSTRAYGQKRKKGHIGKTMGVMAGGKFIDKLQDKVVVSGETVPDVAAKVREGLSQTGPKWGLELTYEVALPEYDVIVFGSTGRTMEAKSFEIVKAGSSKERKELACPGLAHAGAYPLEVVVSRDGDDVHVQFVDAMYRMKMYFEDAGKMAFMRNMGMPGSLADELRDQIRLLLDDYPM